MTGVLDRFPAVLNRLPAELADAVRASATVVQAKSGRTIISSGDSSRQVYLILEGRVQTKLLSPNGKEVILGDLEEGDFFGELAAIDEHPRSASVDALTDCTLACMPARALHAAITEIPAVADWMARRLVGYIRKLTDKVFELNALRVRSRLHCELARMCGSQKAGSVIIDPAPTHADLASRIGTHREAITREIGYLINQGILLQERRRMTIGDVATVKRMARLATGSMDEDFGDAGRAAVSVGSAEA